MISIIICSKSPSLLNAVSANIKATIGVPFEIIGIENSDAKYSICKAYNIGAGKAKYDIFCFAHEDILFVTQNWGINVIDHLKDPSVGLIGIMGADPMLIVPFYPELRVESNVIFVNVDTGVQTHNFETVNADDQSIIKETLGVDGTLMITRRNVFEEFQFDDSTLTAFHGYDVDYSIQVQTKYKVCVVFDVLLKHYFKGGANRSYVIEMLKLTRKWKSLLPLSLNPISHSEHIRLHWIGMAKFVESMIQYNFKSPYILKQYFYLSFNRFFRFKPFISVFKRVIVPKIYIDIKNILKAKPRLVPFSK